LYLRNYDDFLPIKLIYSLLALISFQAQHFSTCSKAFVKLESIEEKNERESEEKEQIEALALSIFTL
jgi:WD repeat-containing protein 35